MTQRYTPRLCIGLPVWNGDEYLAQALDSLLSQTYSDFRLIISDNGSSDGTEAICRAYARRDGRIDYHRSAENRGLAWNFNRVVALADAQYFKWAAHDDLHAPQFLERCIARLDADSEAILCYPTSYVVDERGEILTARREPAVAGGPVASQRFQSVLWHPGFCLMLHGVVRHAVLRQCQPFGAYPASDLLLLAELALRGALREVDEPLFYFRDHARRPYRTCTSEAELAVWIDPQSTIRAELRHVRLFVRYLSTIGRVPLPLSQRLRCWWMMAHWGVVRFPTLQDEVRGSIAGPVRRAARRWTARKAAPDSTTRAA